MGPVNGTDRQEKIMNSRQLARLLALTAGIFAIGGSAEAGVRAGVWDAWGAPGIERPHSQGEQWAALGPEQRREMRQQMRDQWQQSPPARQQERREYREQYRERWQQMPSDDRYRMREEMREQRGRDRGFGGRR